MITEEQLQDALTTTFLANLVFLQEYDNELFQRIDGLSKKIQKEEYKERYRLELIKMKVILIFMILIMISFYMIKNLDKKI